MKFSVAVLATVMMTFGCATPAPRFSANADLCKGTHSVSFSSETKSLVVVGVSHEQGAGPLERCLLEIVAATQPQILIIHAVGPVERMRRRINTLPQMMWEEEDFLFQYANQTGLTVFLTDPNELDTARLARWTSKQIESVVIKNLVFEIMKNSWEKRRKLSSSCDKSCLLQEEAKNFLNQRRWFSENGLWNMVLSDLHISKIPEQQWLRIIEARLDDFARESHFPNFVKFMEYERIYEDQQPQVLAPYPLGMSDFNRLAAIEHRAVNRSELRQIELALQTANRVFAETGHAHLNEYGLELAENLEKKFAMKSTRRGH